MMFDTGTPVATPDGPGTVIEYVRQQTETRGEYVERPAVLLHDGDMVENPETGVMERHGTLKAFPEDELTVEA